MSVAEQRYQAVLAVIAEGRSVTEVAAQWRVSRQTLHAWLARYEAEGLEGLADRSHRPVVCPHQMPASVEARVLEMRRAHPFGGPRRILAEPVRAGSIRCRAGRRPTGACFGLGPSSRTPSFPHQWKTVNLTIETPVSW